MSEIETVVHEAGEVEYPGDAFQLGKQHCRKCGLLLWYNPAPSNAHLGNWLDMYVAGTQVGIRIDKTFTDGTIVGYFVIGDRELEADERRCWPPAPPPARHDADRTR